MSNVSAVIASRDEQNDQNIFSNTSGYDFENIVVVNGNNPSMQRNEGVKKAKGDIIYFLDDDSVLTIGSIDRAVELFKNDEKIGVIGGPTLTPDSDSVLQKTFGVVLGSLISTGKSRARYKPVGKLRKSDEKELILCNMFIKKSVFEELEGFREDLYPNEENEFLNRVQKAGYKIIYSPDIAVIRSRRGDFVKFFRQCFSYGRGRAEQITKNPNIKDLINFAPLFFILYLVSIPFVDFGLGFWYEMPLNLYLLLIVIFSAVNSALIKNVGAFLFSIAAYPVLHISYGVGMVFGFIKSLIPFRKKKEQQVNVRTFEAKE